MIATEEREETFLEIPVGGLVDSDLLPFPLYIKLDSARPAVLYCQKGTAFDRTRAQILMDGGISSLLLPQGSTMRYYSHIEGTLDCVVRDGTIPIEQRAKVLHGTALKVCREIFAKGKPSRDGLRRAHGLVQASALFAIKDRTALIAMRRVLSSSKTLADHCVNVSLLGLGLALHVDPSNPDWVARVGLGGLLHDVGRVGYLESKGDGEDPLHCNRGQRFLQEMGMSEEVVAAAAHHHERFDGGGYPKALFGKEIPPAAAIIGLVDVFEDIYTSHQGRLSVFDCLRIMAQAYRGCFDEKYIRAFVMTFRG